jgi:Yip1 domain
MQEPTTTQAAPVKSMSFSEKLAGIFASPGEVYEDVRLTPKTTSNWVVPTLVLIVVAIVCTMLVMSNPSLQHQFGAAQREAIDKLVQEGRITQEQADRQLEMMGPSSPFMLIGIVASTPIMTFLILFLFALLFWLVGKFAMKASAPYMKVVEVVGLTFYIGAIGRIVTTAMMFVMDSVHASPSLALLVSNFSMQDKVHQALAAVNIFTIWSLVVTAIGLAKLFQRDMPKVLVLVFALWVLLSGALILLGIQLG